MEALPGEIECHLHFILSMFGFFLKISSPHRVCFEILCQPNFSVCINVQSVCC